VVTRHVRELLKQFVSNNYNYIKLNPTCFYVQPTGTCTFFHSKVTIAIKITVKKALRGDANTARWL